MSETKVTSTTVVVLDERTRLDADDFARVCGTTTAFVEELVVEGLLAPPASDGFAADAVTRVRRVLRLQRDFDAPLGCIGVLLDLLEENEHLRAQLRRAGFDPG